MHTYIACTTLYNKDLLQEADPETGVLRLVEAGFVHPGQFLELSDERAEILLAIGAIAPAPSAEVPQAEAVVDTESAVASAPTTPERRSRR